MKLFSIGKLTSTPFLGVHSVRVSLDNPDIATYHDLGRIKTIRILGVLRVAWVTAREGR